MNSTRHLIKKFSLIAITLTIIAAADVAAMRGNFNSFMLALHKKDSGWAALLLNGDRALVHATDQSEATLLHHATASGNYEFAKLLLTYGALPNVPDNIGFTSVHWAAYNGNTALCTLLLVLHKANPNAKCLRGRTPLHWATLRNSAEVITILLAAGAKSNARDKDGKTAADLQNQTGSWSLCTIS